jgi:putative modified peptide
VNFQLPDAVVDTLLDKLASDDDFRLRFTNDTRDALASIGYMPAADKSIIVGTWFCLRVEQLASKEAIQAGRAALRERLTSAFIPLMPFALEAADSVVNRAA